MRTYVRKSRWLLNLVKILLDIAWVFNFVFVVLFIFISTMAFVKNDYINYYGKLELPLHTAFIDSYSLFDEDREMIINKDGGELTMKYKITMDFIVLFYLGFSVAYSLTMYLLHQLRKLFRNLKKNQVFTFENVKILKITAICIVSFYPLEWITNLILLRMILNCHDTILSGFQLSFTLTANFQVLLMGVFIYILADIFRLGLEIEEENKEFV